MENKKHVDDIVGAIAEILDEFHEEIYPLMSKGRLYDSIKEDCEIPDDIDVKSYIIKLKENSGAAIGDFAPDELNGFMQYICENFDSLDEVKEKLENYDDLEEKADAYDEFVSDFGYDLDEIREKLERLDDLEEISDKVDEFINDMRYYF